MLPRSSIPWLGFLLSCGGAPDRGSISELRTLRENRDYFALRERLESYSQDERPDILLFGATVQHAFNQLEESNATLERLLERAPPDEALVFESRALRVKNDARLYRYRAALETSELILASPTPEGHEEDVADLRNVARLLEALADVPPQTAEIRGPTVLRVDESHHVPLVVGGMERSYTFDTGANFSVLMRSEAEALGLAIRPAGVELGTSTDARIPADVAVAEQVAMGNIDYRHVVFLVLADEHLSFPGGFRIPGIIGFPLIQAMGEVTFGADGTVSIPGRSSGARAQNLAFEELVPLTRVRYAGDSLICRLDTGASATDFYQPFYEKYRARVESQGTQTSHRTGGAGGVQEIPAYTLPEIRIELGGSEVTLLNRPVYTRRITEEKDNYLLCNVGTDALSQFAAYTIDFQGMWFSLASR